MTILVRASVLKDGGKVGGEWGRLNCEWMFGRRGGWKSVFECPRDEDGECPTKLSDFSYSSSNDSTWFMAAIFSSAPNRGW